METIYYPLLGALAVMAVSLIGGIAMISSVSRGMHKILHYLPSLAAGVFLIIAYSLVEEAQHALSMGLLALFSSIGILLLISVTYLFPETEECHDETCEKKPDHAKAGRVMTADSIHNMSDGIILVPAFAASTELGIAVLVGVLVHEIVQELSEYFIFIESGLTRAQALKRNFISASTVLVGVVIGYFLTSHEFTQAAILGIASGMFLYVVFKDLIPHSLENRSPKEIIPHILLFVAGIGIMLATSLIAPHIHPEDDHGDEHYEEERTEEVVDVH